MDPIPTELLKKVLPAIIHLTKLVNESLQTGEFPDDLKKALVTPLLKKPSLEPIPKNYRPVSNLPFIGKLMERCVIDQLMEHIHANNLMEPLQLAYRSHHSTETVLLKVKTDILKAMDNQEVTCLVLLDLSATFDMVDHKILLERLENYFGITGIALRWIESYLTNWSQQSCNWRYEHDWCQDRQHQFKVWCTTGQCIRANFIHSLHIPAWSNLFQ